MPFKACFVLPLYNLLVKSYTAAIYLAARWNKKAAAWVAGRRNIFEHLQHSLLPGDRFIWVHCSSAGEFEQGKPVIEALKKKRKSLDNTGPSDAKISPAKKVTPPEKPG